MDISNVANSGDSNDRANKGSPSVDDEQRNAGAIQRLIKIMRALRDPDTGCPWDVKQDFASIAPYTIEEAYEVADVIQRQAWQELPDELGDLLLQVVFHARMAQEQGWFDFADVAHAISDKMQQRHPHVFADANGKVASVEDAEQQTKIWEAQKRAERQAKGMHSVLDDVPIGLAGLTRGLKLQKRAATVGFDWPDAQQVDDKLQEELIELQEARDSKDREKIQDELGDVFFVLTNLGRKLGIDPAAAMRHANAKFERRFKAMEQLALQQGTSMDELNLEQQEALWQAVKVVERGVDID